MHRKGAIDDVCRAQDHRTTLNRHIVSAQAWRCHITGRHKDPIGRLDLVRSDQFFWRQRRPTRIVVAVAPIDPGRRPLVAGHPVPAEASLECPTTVVVDDPAPIGFDIVGDPVPAPLIGINPVPVSVWTPIRRHAGRYPDVAEPRMRAPTAVLLKRNLGVFGNLRRSRCECAEHDRSRDCREGYSAPNQGNGSQTAQLMSDSHTYSPAPRGLPAASQISSNTRR
jgi:hypothetical protein